MLSDVDEGNSLMLTRLTLVATLVSPTQASMYGSLCYLGISKLCYVMKRSPLILILQIWIRSMVEQ